MQTVDEMGYFERIEVLHFYFWLVTVEKWLEIKKATP